MAIATARSAGWRVPAPPASATIDWPAWFGTRFIVTVDVEEEFDWSAPFTRAAGLTALAALPSAQDRFRDAGTGLACMIDYPAAADPAAADILRRVLLDPAASLGAQLHPWVTPPFDEVPSQANSFAGNLPAELEAAKLDALTTQLVETFGRAPLAFRSGRYGLAPRTTSLLHARGYRIDSSMRTGFDYAPVGGPDFTAIDAAAFAMDGLIELPLTSVYTGALRRCGRALHRIAGHLPYGRGMLAHAGILSRVPLTPEGVTRAQALTAVNQALEDGARLLVLAFHSPSLAPGHTPYVRDANDLAAFWRWWDAVLALLAARGVRSATFADIVAAATPLTLASAGPAS